MLPSIVIIATFYIICDIYLTGRGVWGFNPRYHLAVYIFDLPIEEVLFFILIPYASIFLHDSFVLYFPEIKLNEKTGKILTVMLIFTFVLVALFHTDKTYTVYSSSLMILALFLSLFDKTALINRFYITFLIIIIPFLLVNAVLTGSFIEQEVVWYNNHENLGIRIFTIPVEDFGYGFSLILFNLLLISKLRVFL